MGERRESNCLPHSRASRQNVTVTQDLLALADDLEAAAAMIRSQVPHKVFSWMRRIHSSLSAAWASPLRTILGDVRRFTNNGHAATWQRNSREARSGKNTLGYHLDSVRSQSPIDVDAI